jgi:hypothetical protein
MYSYAWKPRNVKPQHDGEEEPELERAAMARLQRVVGDRQREAGGHEQDRVEQRDSRSLPSA